MQAKGAFCAAAGVYFRKSSRKRGESGKSAPYRHEIAQNFTVSAAALLDSASVLSEFAEILRDSMKSRRNPVRMRAFPPEITKIRQILQNFAKGLTIYIYIYIMDCTESCAIRQLFVHFSSLGGNSNAHYFRHEQA